MRAIVRERPRGAFRNVFVFIIYAAGVWALIVRDRRRWRALLWLGLGTAGIVLTAWVHTLIGYWSGQQLYLPVLRTILLPFGLLVICVGAFIAALPRTPAYRACRRCRYDMSMIDSPARQGAEACPECGTRHAFDHSLTGPCVDCGTTLGHGSGEHQPCRACGTIHIERPRRIPVAGVCEQPLPLDTSRVLEPAAKVMRYFAKRASTTPQPIRHTKAQHAKRQTDDKQQPQRDELTILQR